MNLANQSDVVTGKVLGMIFGAGGKVTLRPVYRQPGLADERHGVLIAAPEQNNRLRDAAVMVGADSLDEVIALLTEYRDALRSGMTETYFTDAGRACDTFTIADRMA